MHFVINFYWTTVQVAERVAKERGERCGEGNSVGFQIRLERYHLL